MPTESSIMKKKRRFTFDINFKDRDFYNLYHSAMYEIFRKFDAEVELKVLTMSELPDKPYRFTVLFLGTDAKYKVVTDEIKNTLGFEIKEEKQQ